MAIEQDRALILEVARRRAESSPPGLRNPDGLDWHPDTGALWTTVNEGDELGSDLLPNYAVARQLLRTPPRHAPRAAAPGSGRAGHRARLCAGARIPRRWPRLQFGHLLTTASASHCTMAPSRACCAVSPRRGIVDRLQPGVKRIGKRRKRAHHARPVPARARARQDCAGFPGAALVAAAAVVLGEACTAAAWVPTIVEGHLAHLLIRCSRSPATSSSRPARSPRGGSPGDRHPGRSTPPASTRRNLETRRARSSRLST